jgi:hypothetical protein
MTASDTPTSAPRAPKRCAGTTRHGRPCRAWATKESDYCPAHQPGTKKALPPLRPRHRPPRRLETINDLVADLLGRLSHLSALIDEANETGDFLKLMAVYSRVSTHLAPLMREQRLLPDNSSDDLMQLIGRALDEISEELGIKL